MSTFVSPVIVRLPSAVALVCAGLIACASPPKPAVVAGSIQAAAQLNPSVNKRPSPLQVRIYELKAAAAFGSADFMSLYQSDQSALASEFVAREEFVLQPGGAWSGTLHHRLEALHDR